MARPQKETVDYFSHDTDASTRKTLTIMRGAFGLVGIGFWWTLLEELGRCDGHVFDVRNPIDLEFLLQKIGTDLVSGTEMLGKLAFLGGIDPILWEHRVIWSQNFVDRLSDVYEKRKGGLPQKPCFCDGNCQHTSISAKISAPETPVIGAEIPHTILYNSKLYNSIVPSPNKKEQPKKKENPIIFEIFGEMRDFLGYEKGGNEHDPIPNYGKEGNFIKKMLTRGFTRVEILSCWKNKVSQRGGEFVSMVWVNEDIGKKQTMVSRGKTKSLSSEEEIAQSIKEVVI